MTEAATALAALKAAVSAAEGRAVLDGYLPGLAPPARVWADVLDADSLVLTGASVTAGEGESDPIEIKGTLDVLTGPEPVTVKLFRPEGSTDAGEVECLVIWDDARDGWSPALAYLEPGGPSIVDTAAQAVLRGVSVDAARRIFSSFDFTRNAAAAQAPGLLPDWLGGRAPAAGLTLTGGLRLASGIAELMAPVVDVSGSLAITANVDVAVDDLRLTVSHAFDAASPPSFQPFDAGPRATLAAVTFSFPIDGWSTAPAAAGIEGSLSGEGAAMNIALSVDFLQSTAILSAVAGAGKPAPSLAWAVASLGLPGGAPALPPELGAITLTAVAGTFDLQAKGLTAYEATFATSGPLSLFGDLVTLQPSLHVDVRRGDSAPGGVDLFGLWKVGGEGAAAIETLIDTRSGEVCARLAEGTSLQLPATLKAQLPDFLLSDLKIIDLDLTGNSKSGTYGVVLETAGTLGVEIEGKTFGVEDVGFEAIDGGSGLLVSGHGTIDMLGGSVGVRIAVGPNVRLSFALANLNLSDLAEIFLSALGTTADLGDLVLKDLLLTVEHPTGNFHVHGALASPLRLGGDSAWEIDEAVFDAARTIPGAAGLTAALAGVVTLAGTRVAVSADYADAKGRFTGRTDPAAEVDFTHLLRDVFAKFDLELPAQVPDFKLKNLAFEYDSATGDFAFSGENTVATKVQLGNVEHDIHTTLDLKVTTDAAGKRAYSGFLRGKLTLGSAVFEVEYDFGDATLLKGSWDGAGGALQFSDLAASHGVDHTLQPPDGMSLELKSAAFEFDIVKSRFVLSATSEYGEAFFIASDANGQWDFAFGVLIDFSEIPGFPSLGPLNLKDAVLILSTVRDDRFKVPSLPGAPQPAGQPAAAGHAFPALTAIPMRLSPGVSVAALLSLEDTGDPILGKLSGVVGKSELLIQVSFDQSAHSASFLSYLNGSLTISIGGEKLVLSNVFIKLDADPVDVLISGSLFVPFDHVTIEASGELAVSPTGMQALFQLKAEADGKPASLPSPFGLRGVELDELDIEVGAIFEPPSLDLGIEGKFNIGGQPPGANEFTIVVELEEEIPNPTYLSTHIQTLTIEEVVTVYSGGLASNVPAVLNELRAEDLSIYWSERAGTLLPDGSQSKMGFGFSGTLIIGGFSAHAALAVGATGVEGDAELPPIDWGVFSLKGSGKGGGATVAISSMHSPFIDISAQATLFNLVSAEVEIEVTDSGFNYKQKEDVGGVFHAEFDCTVSKSGFRARSEFDLDIKGEVGPIVILGIDFGTLSLDVGFHTLFDVSVDDQGFELTVAGSFEFEGLSLTMPTLTLHEDFRSLEELPGKILKQIDDNAEELFEDLFDEAKKLLNDAKEEAEKIAGAVAAEAEQVAAEAEAAAKQVEAGAEQAAAAIAKGAVEVEAKAAQMAQEAEAAITDTANQVAAIAGTAAAEAGKIADEIVDVGKRAEREVEKIGEAVEAEVKQIAAVAEAVWNDAVQTARNIERAAEQAFDDALDAAQKAGEAMLDEAKIAASAIENEAVEIGNQIAEKAEEAARWLESAGESAWNEVKKY